MPLVWQEEHLWNVFVAYTKQYTLPILLYQFLVQSYDYSSTQTLSSLYKMLITYDLMCFFSFQRVMQNLYRGIFYSCFPNQVMRIITDYLKTNSLIMQCTAEIHHGEHKEG
jgi:hypothetical protein